MGNPHAYSNAVDRTGYFLPQPIAFCKQDGFFPIIVDNYTTTLVQTNTVYIISKLGSSLSLAFYLRYLLNLALYQIRRISRMGPHQLSHKKLRITTTLKPEFAKDFFMLDAAELKISSLLNTIARLRVNHNTLIGLPVFI